MPAPFFHQEHKLKLKITERGWAGFTGDFGPVSFVDGVSVREVTEIEAFRLSNLIQIETLEGVNPSSSQQNLDSQSLLMASGMDHKAIEEAVKRTVHVYSRTDLESIAEQDGIGGLRTIATPMGISGRSINALIDAILAYQGNNDPVQIGLVGSTVQPAVFEIDGKTVGIGQVVAHSFTLSKLTTTEWNALPVEIREQKIEEGLKDLKGVAE